LSVFDISGRKVANLAKGEKAPGTYQVHFDGTQFTGGIYFYKLKTEMGVLSRKLILVK
jgi:hypothetical protein